MPVEEESSEVIGSSCAFPPLTFVIMQLLHDKTQQRNVLSCCVATFLSTDVLQNGVVVLEAVTCNISVYKLEVKGMCYN